MKARGWLIDVYETVLRVDLRGVGAGLAALADVPLEAFGAAIRPFGQRLTVGTVTWPEVFTAVLRECGREPSDDLVEALVDADRRLLREHATVLDDGLDLLVRLRATEARTALVSNCAPHTGSLLAELGIARHVDHLVLSCEVGAAKPEPTIFRVALDLLDVTPGEAVLVDDQSGFCAGAVELGMSAIQVGRGPDAGSPTGSEGWVHSNDLTRVEIDVP